MIMKPEKKLSQAINNSEEDRHLNHDTGLPSRRRFLQAVGLGAAVLGLQQAGCSAQKSVVNAGMKSQPVIQDLSAIPGFEKSATVVNSGVWKPVSDRKIRVGLIGYGVCEFAAQFSFQTHPNVEVVAVSDLIPERCAQLAKVTGCNKTYPSLEELIKDDTIEAVFIATDAPSHFKHTIAALKHGKHVACAVPAVFGSLEEADELYELVKKSGLKYMMYETSAYHADVYAMREIYKAGGFGKLVFSEGEYYHYFGEPLDSYKGWRTGLPPQWYPTHSNGYYICVTGRSFTEVSCLGLPSAIKHLQAAHNVYKNPFGTEIALFRTSEGGMSRMAVSWDTPGFGAEAGRIRGEKGSFHDKYQGLEQNLPDLNRPALPPGVEAGYHDGSHGYLTAEFVEAILQDRHPLVNIAMALNLTVPGIVAHQSALKGGEWMKIPQYKL
jgi:predicted dehydrogenase